MSGFFSGLFGGKKQTTQPSAALRITTSIQGIVLPWLLGGQQRLAGNLIWYGNFFAVPAYSQPSSGGKGGLFGGSKASSGYNYYANFMLAACEGPDISSIPFVWVNGTQFAEGVEAAAIFLGDYAQTPWGGGDGNYYRGVCYAAFGSFALGSSAGLPQINLEVLSTNTGQLAGQPDGDVTIAWTKILTDPFRGVGFPTARMGSLTSWQQYCLATGMLVSPVLGSSVAAQAFAKDLLTATNSEACWSAGFLTVVPYGDTQIVKGATTPASETHIVSVLTDQIQVTFSSTFIVDNGVKYSGSGISLTKVSSPAFLTVGTYYLSAPGFYNFAGADAGQTVIVSYNYAATASYTPNVTPIYALTLDNFLPNQGGTIGSGLSSGASPVTVVRKPRDQMLNVVKLTYLDRVNSYNPVTIEVKNEAAIQAFGRWRADQAKQFDFFCLAAAAQQSAALMLQREQIARTFQWTSGKEFILLDVMDIVNLTDVSQGLVNQAVRITEIQENTDASLTFTAEEFLGTATAPLYNIQANSGFVPGFNTVPGPANPPIIFEPSDELGGGLEIWAAISGSVPTNWGGCYVWISYDGVNYSQLPTPMIGTSRMGVTTTDCPAVTINAAGQTIDQSTTLGVDLTESAGVLTTATQLDATSLNTACYIGPLAGTTLGGFSSGFSSGFSNEAEGEIIAFANAALTGTSKYNLTYLVRGAFGTEDNIIDHPVGSSFARLDSVIFKFPYEASRIGSTLFIKLQGFNQYQGGLQPLSGCAVYTYVISGSALATPLPNVNNLYSNYEAGFQKVYWDEVQDFRSGILYEIRQGPSWATGLFIRTQAHPPFIAQGNGTFWVSARCQPASGILVYSEQASEIVISGNQLSANLLASFDEKATMWQGTFQPGLGIDSGTNSLRIGGSGNILGAGVITEALTTSSSSIATSNTLTFSSVPGTITNGMFVYHTAGLTLNGSTQFLSIASDIANVSTPGSSYSFSAWFKTTGTSGVIWGGMNTNPPSAPTVYTPHLYVGSDGKLYGGYFNGTAVQTVNTPNVVNTGVWHHAVVVVNGAGGLTLYMDGALIGSGGTGSQDNAAEPNTFIGVGYGNAWPNLAGMCFFNGSLADCRAYKAHQLSSAEVASLYLGGNVTAGQIGEYLLQTATGTDNSGNSNTMTLTGAPSTIVAGPQPLLSYFTSIPANTTVIGTTPTTVTLSANLTGAGIASGDQIEFSLSDIIEFGGVLTNTALYYTIPTSHIIKSSAITKAAVNATAQIAGVPDNVNVLALANVLTVADILNSASTQFVDGWVEINVSQDGGITYAGWQKFIPGVFPGNAWNFRLALESTDSHTIAYALQFNFTVQLPARIDHYQQKAIGSGGTTITFQQDGSAVTEPFNGGPSAANLPYYSVSWQATTGDTYTVTGLSLSQMTIQFFNGGVGVARTANIAVEGY